MPTELGLAPDLACDNPTRSGEANTTLGKFPSPLDVLPSPLPPPPLASGLLNPWASWAGSSCSLMLRGEVTWRETLGGGGTAMTSAVKERLPCDGERGSDDARRERCLGVDAISGLIAGSIELVGSAGCGAALASAELLDSREIFFFLVSTRR